MPLDEGSPANQVGRPAQRLPHWPVSEALAGNPGPLRRRARGPEHTSRPPTEIDEERYRGNQPKTPVWGFGNVAVKAHEGVTGFITFFHVTEAVTSMRASTFAGSYGA